MKDPKEYVMKKIFIIFVLVNIIALWAMTFSSGLCASKRQEEKDKTANGTTVPFVVDYPYVEGENSSQWISTGESQYLIIGNHAFWFDGTNWWDNPTVGRELLAQWG